MLMLGYLPAKEITLLFLVHCASYWPLVLSEVPSVALGNPLDGIPQITWSPLPPAGCRPWLGWVSHFWTSESHPSFFHQITLHCRADLVEVHSLIMQHPCCLRTEGLRESLPSEPLCLTAKQKDYSRIETATLKAYLQGWPSAGICELGFRENSFILIRTNQCL